MKKRESPHATAKMMMTQEKARISGKKNIKDPRTAALEEAARAWQRQKEEERIREELRLETERQKGAWGAAFAEIRPEDYIKAKDAEHREQEVIDWTQRPVAELTGKGISEPKTKKNLNAASIWLFARKLMAREWARATGKKLPDPRAFALEREARIWDERREEERNKLQREKEMVESFCQFLSDEGKFNQAKKERWDFGGVEFLVTKLKNGWNVYVEALEPSLYMRRKGWGDLLGIYKVRVNRDLNIACYSRKKDSPELERQE